jgi:deubiquitinase DESI2
MGGAISGGAAATGEYPVVLNVYDLTPLNNYVHWCGLGIFHSAVEGERCSSTWSRRIL